MIEADAAEAFAALARRLEDRAQTLADAHARARREARRTQSAPWRQAGIVWPLFAKG
jgi:hypothetical protein